jgi:hypothetical protein
MAAAQALEGTLAAYLTLARPDAAAGTRTRLRKAFRRANAKSLGELVTALRGLELTEKENATLNAVSTIFKRRHFIAHQFFRKPSRRGMLQTAEGRATMILEAQRDFTDLRFWTNKLAPFVLMHAVRLGESSDHLREHGEWLKTFVGDLDDLRTEARVAVNVDPTLAVEIAEMMEDIEQRADA